MFGKKVPPIKEIADKYMVRTRPRYALLWLYRWAGLPITWLILHTPISANGVTFTAILFGVFGSALIMLGDYWLSITGALGLFIYFFLDHLDGNVARYYNHRTVTGEFLDDAFHNDVSSLIYLALGIGAYNQFGNIIYFYAGAFGAVAHMLGRLGVSVKWRLLSQYLGNIKIHSYDVKVQQSVVGRALLFMFSFPNLHLINIVIVAAILNKLHWLALFYGAQLTLRVLPFKYLLYRDLGTETEHIIPQLNTEGTK